MFGWNEDLDCWQCLRCYSTKVKVIRFDIDTRMRFDVDQKLICQNCGNSEIM